MDFLTICKHIKYDPATGKFTRLLWAAPLAPSGPIEFRRSAGHPPLIKVDKKRKHLGSSPDKDVAIKMRRDAEARFTPYAY